MTDSPGVTPAVGAGEHPRCTATTNAGAPCRNRPLPDRQTCLFHDPDAGHAARSRGAMVSNRLRAIRGHQPRLDNVPRLVNYVSRLVYQVMAAEVDQNIARTVIYALMLQKGLIEVGDIEKRLAAVEQRLEANQQPKGRTVPWVG